jgi:RhtB (resistance to homoserine/threonine) family protein
VSYAPPVAQLLEFVAVAALLTITPGADMALVMRFAIGGGVRQALYASFGICLGLLIWGAASALGVSVILTRSTIAFDVLKYAGGIYLIYLGARAIHDALRRTPDPRSPIPDPRSRRAADCFVQGLLTNLLNPKVAVFYLTFLPQFVVRDRNILSQSLMLASTHVLMGLVWLTIYARFLDRMAATLLTTRFRQRIEAVTGTVLMAFGIRLALARR